MPDIASLAGLQTESRNPTSTNIDTVTTLDLCKIINDEDRSISDVVRGCVPTIARAIDAIAARVRDGGRVIYIGAGTSGRLGVLDASEIPPTYSAPPSQFIGLIAGGDVALRSAKEGAEDSTQAAVDDLSPLMLDGDRDSLIGIASSGRTPYVLGGLALAKSKGCLTTGVACSAPSAMSKSGDVDFMINAVTGPEVVTGSTRMKAGTATKLVLNMISTGIMIKLGKTYGNIMVDVKPTNMKLQMRARNILREICGDHCPTADRDLDLELSTCGNNVKLTAVKIALGMSVGEAERLLHGANGVLAAVLEKPKVRQKVETKAVTKYVLCIDGGGSKCNAVLVSDKAEVGIGTSGACNPNDVGIDGTISAIKAAVDKAIGSCASTQSRGIKELSILETWISLAGGDREPTAKDVRSAAVALFGGDLDLRVTNDIDLLTTAASREFDADEVTVIIAGTGSIAARYRREGSVLRRERRAGGWGALLGDDGSGFDIGRQALRRSLQTLEEDRISRTSTGRDPLVDTICQHFGAAECNEGETNLLTSILLSANETQQSPSELRRRIAGCAEAVIAIVETSVEAKGILQNAVDSLFNLARVVQRETTSTGTRPILVLAGGLFNCSLIRETLTQKLEKAGMQFFSIKQVQNPALDGARFLAKELGLS